MACLAYGDVGHRLMEIHSAKRMPLMSSLEQAYHQHSSLEESIQTHTLDINQYGANEDYLTCMSLSKELGVIAIGSGNKAGNLYFIKDASVINDTEPSYMDLKPLHKESLKTPIYSMDCSKDQLLIGTGQGVVKRYRLQENEGLHLSLVGQYVNASSKIQLGPFLWNTHVKSVQFSPTNTSLVSCTMMNQLNLWYSEEIVQSYQSICQSPLQFANWSPHQTLVVSGGYDRKLFVIDSRIKEKEVWSVDQAHDRPIQDAQFNPFIPYWLASAGEDSVVNLWDMRASQHSPVAKIDGNIGSVNSIAWSNVRPENIGTTSSDGFMRYWSLSPESFPAWDTHYRTTRYSNQDTLPIVRERDQHNMWCIKDQNYTYSDAKPWKTDAWLNSDEDVQAQRSAKLLSGALYISQWGKQRTPSTDLAEARGPVVSIKTSLSIPGTYYSITGGGQLSVHMIRYDITSHIKNRYRFDPKNEKELAAQIEDDIYCRRIQSAQQKLEELKSLSDSEHSTAQDREDISFLEDCLIIHPPIKETDWELDSLPDASYYRVSEKLGDAADAWQFAIDQFRSDLKYWSYHIPPGYNKNNEFPLDLKCPCIIDVQQKAKLLKPEALVESNDDTVLPIKVRRNMEHIPSIVTKPASPSPSKEAPYTPPYSGASQSVEAYTNTNPFEQRPSVEHSPPPIQESRNPFKQHSPPISAKEFNNPFLVQLENQKESSEGLVQEDKRHSGNSLASWVSSSSHHLGSKFSRHSTSDDSVQSSHSKFNPFKSFKSLKIHRDDSKNSTIKREPSSINRRNALHGPF
ncbi:WD40-repeat-containing domain protein [Choanephora cucurbitarum]|nr:WD40-repeat-containing domain protein [Choanephora cucurbitarum]